VERKSAVAATLYEVGRRDLFPAAVIKIYRTRVRSIIVSFHRRSARLAVSAGGIEFRFDDLCVAVAPLPADQLDAAIGGKIDRCVRFARWQILSGNRERNE